MDTKTKRKPLTPEEIITEQKRIAEAAKPRANAVVPARVAAGTAVTTPAPDTRTAVQKYIDEIAPANIVGRMVKFSKDSQFVTTDGGEPVDEAAEFIALGDETLIGWIRFHRHPIASRVCSTTASRCRL
ncbi:MAG: hypothetical protein WA375_22405, partial [Pseudolabrys sp.]